MITVDFLIREFSDGRLMILFGFKDGKNFRSNENANIKNYTWCPHEDDIKLAVKVYEAINEYNKKLIKNMIRDEA